MNYSTVQANATTATRSNHALQTPAANHTTTNNNNIRHGLECHRSISCGSILSDMKFSSTATSNNHHTSSLLASPPEMLLQPLHHHNQQRSRAAAEVHVVVVEAPHSPHPPPEEAVARLRHHANVVRWIYIPPALHYWMSLNW